jgi:cytochrome c-type biogenesis protein CcmH
VTLFVVIAAVMVAAALAWVLVPLLRRAVPTGIAGEASNVALLRDQLAELDADLANGTLHREQFEQARRELEQRVLEESRAVSVGTLAAPPAAAAWTAAILAGGIPIAALLLMYAGIRLALDAASRAGGRTHIALEQMDRMARAHAAAQNLTM